MAWRAGDRVRLPHGQITVVLDVDDEDLVIVQLDGDVTGAYPETVLRTAENATPDEEDT